MSQDILKEHGFKFQTDWWNVYIRMLHRRGCTNNNIEGFFSRYNKWELVKASMTTTFERFREFDVLAQSDMVEASQTPRKWCNPSRKLEVLRKIQSRIKLVDKFYNKHFNQNLLIYFKIVFAYKQKQKI